ncbi:hypothetical protein [Neisseria sicca]|uniref:hypothetical protein n=1 Tax=Neisseria sicca TaxID=490 RepID=UPI0002FFE95B|nr:hypothetical protein [Neisseria sicca]
MPRLFSDDLYIGGGRLTASIYVTILAPVALLCLSAAFSNMVFQFALCYKIRCFN